MPLTLTVLLSLNCCTAVGAAVTVLPASPSNANSTTAAVVSVNHTVVGWYYYALTFEPDEHTALIQVR